MTAAEYLDQLDQLRAAGTSGTWDVYWGDHIGSGVIKTSPGGVQVDYDICEMQDEDDRACTDNAINPAFPSDDAALIVAAVNALRQLTAALRAVLTLADEFSELAALNEERADDHERTGRREDEQYRLGRAVSYRQAATKLGEVITAALSPAESPR